MAISRQYDKDSGRPTVLLVVLFAHGVLVLVFFKTSQLHLSPVEPQPLSINVLPVSRHSSNTHTDKNALAPFALPPILKVVPPIGLQGANAITLLFETDTPAIDWENEAGLAVQDIVTRREQTKGRRNLAGPSQAQLERSIKAAPGDSAHHAGDTEHLDGGLLTWINDRCYYTTAGVSTTSTTGRTTLKVCKPKESASGGDLFKDMRQKLDGGSIDAVP